ncbi:MAG: hypothetical protein HY718_01200 [Planctomycetes bacterium]|nr:hypothetical protein [Planctomycetota bacterium]
MPNISHCRRAAPTLSRAGVLGAWLGLILAGIAEAAPEKAPPPSSLAGLSFDRAMVIPITTEINDVTFESMKRRLNLARRQGIRLVVVELDTPGGALGPTLKICSALKGWRDEGMKVYAWVHHDAYSAGAIIALATDGVVMAPNATMGDCQPIVMTEKGVSGVPADLEAKMVSPLLEELRDSARRNGYDQDLIEALVRPDVHVFWVINGDTGEKRFVTASERDELFGRRASAGGDDGKGAAVKEPVPDSESKTAWRYVREDPVLGEVRQPVTGTRELLTMKDTRALAYGFSLGTVAGEQDLRSFLGILGAIERTDLTWMETIVQFLASPVVRAILLMLIILGVYVELHAPGVGMPGAVALVALMLFLGAPYMTGFTVTWEIVVIVLGLALLAVELFVIPGFGVVGVAGLILLGFGILSSFAPPEPFRRHWFDLPELPQTYRYMRNGLIAMTGGLTGAAVCMFALAKYLPRAPIMNRIITRNPTHEDVTIEDPYHGIAKVGDVGRAETLLRPAGKARFGAMLVDVVSQGEYIPSGEKVEVIERSGARVVVRRMA